MTDTELLNWIEQNRAELWCEKDKHTGDVKKWTVQARHQPGGYHGFVQSARPSLREAIIAAMKGEP